MKLLLRLCLLGGVMALTSCKDIIEPSLKNRKIFPEAPGNAYESTSYTLNFWWDPVDDALNYHLQVVSPDFKQIGSLVLDTLLRSNKFTFSLSPGNYQWRVRAENGSSQTPYCNPLTFSIVTTSLSHQTVQVTGPANNLLTNRNSVNLQWSALYGADKYQLEIDTNNFADETTLVYNQLTPALQYNFTFPRDQVYQWRIRAQNDTTKSQWSAINTIIYDHTPPARVVLSQPANQAQVSLPAGLQWENVATAVKYKVYVFKTDSVTSYGPAFPLTVTSNNYNLTTGSSGDRVYWRVSAIDAAGNEGTVSAMRSFVWR